MASGYSHYDDDDYDDGVIYAEPRHVLHPGMEQQPGHGSRNTGNRDTERRPHRDDNPGMSALTGHVSGMKLDGTSKSEKQSLYRCDLETTINNVKRGSGLDVDGNEIFVENLSTLLVHNMNEGLVKVIKFKALQLESVWDVKVCNNLLYVSDVGKNKKVILIMDKNGNIKFRIGLPLQEVGIEGGPLGLAIDEITKDIYVSSANTNTVYICPLGSDHFKPFITNGLSWPNYLCMSPGRDVIVSNRKSHVVKKYTSGGKMVWMYGGQGSGNGQLNGPQGICTDPYGNVYVADGNNNRVVQISSDGKFLSNVTCGKDFEKPLALAFRDNRLIVTTGLLDERIKENEIYVVKCQFVLGHALKSEKRSSICVII